MTSSLTTEMKPQNRICELSVCATELGWFGFALRHETVLAVTIGDRSESAALKRLKSKIVDLKVLVSDGSGLSQVGNDLREKLQRYAAGDRITFGNSKIYEDDLTPFQKQVIRVVRQIPVGQTLSYAEVASQAGSPKAARAVGNVMANNRTPIIVPCHRVLAAGGGWGGFTAPGGIDFKRRLLSLEADT